MPAERKKLSSELSAYYIKCTRENLIQFEADNTRQIFCKMSDIACASSIARLGLCQQRRHRVSQTLSFVSLWGEEAHLLKYLIHDFPSIVNTEEIQSSQFILWGKTFPWVLNLIITHPTCSLFMHWRSFRNVQHMTRSDWKLSTKIVFHWQLVHLIFQINIFFSSSRKRVSFLWLISTWYEKKN